jgi:hypothetical protein
MGLERPITGLQATGIPDVVSEFLEIESVLGTGVGAKATGQDLESEHRIYNC